MITLSLCRERYTVYMNRDGSSISQFRNVRDGQDDENAQIQKLSNALCVHMAVETSHKLRKGAANVCQEGRCLEACMCARPLICANEESTLHQLVMQKEENDLLTAGVEASTEHVQSFAEIDRTILWDVQGYTRRIYGHPEELGALTMTYHCDHCQTFPLSDCTWYVFSGNQQKRESHR